MDLTTMRRREISRMTVRKARMFQTLASMVALCMSHGVLATSSEPERGDKTGRPARPMVVELDGRPIYDAAEARRSGRVPEAGARRTFETPIWNVDGIPDQGRFPRTSIAAGRDLVGQVADGSFESTVAFYDKATGALVAGPTPLTDLGCSSKYPMSRQPVIAYDDRADRWLVAFIAPASSYDTGCMLISRNANPDADGWDTYFFSEPFDLELLQPTIAVGEDAYFLNYFSLVSFVVALEREPMLDGLPTRRKRLGVPSSNRLVPVARVGEQTPSSGSPGLYLRLADDEIESPGTADPDRDFIEIWTFDVDFDDESNSQLAMQVAIPIGELVSDVGPIQQPDLSEVFGTSRLQWPPKYRIRGNHESILTTLPVRAEPGVEGRSAVRWLELRREGGGPWVLHQEGTWDGSVDSRLAPNIVDDAFGNVTLVANVVGPSTFPGLRYAGRRFDDPLGTLSSTDLSVIEGTSVTAGVALGPTSAVVDPTDECTFFVAGQHHQATTWSTRITALRFEACAARIFADGFESGDASGWSDVRP